MGVIVAIKVASSASLGVQKFRFGIKNNTFYWLNVKNTIKKTVTKIVFTKNCYVFSMILA